MLRKRHAEILYNRTGFDVWEEFEASKEFEPIAAELAKVCAFRAACVLCNEPAGPVGTFSGSKLVERPRSGVERWPRRGGICKPGLVPQVPRHSLLLVNLSCPATVMRKPGGGGSPTPMLQLCLRLHRPRSSHRMSTRYLVLCVRMLSRSHFLFSVPSWIERSGPAVVTSKGFFCPPPVFFLGLRSLGCVAAFCAPKPRHGSTGHGAGGCVAFFFLCFSRSAAAAAKVIRGCTAKVSFGCSSRRV